MENVTVFCENYLIVVIIPKKLDLCPNDYYDKYINKLLVAMGFIGSVKEKPAFRVKVRTLVNNPDKLLL